MADTRCLHVALRALIGFAQACHLWWNRRSLNERALVRITSCGGRVAVSYPASGQPLPVIPGLNDGQMFDPRARIHVWLPALPHAEWNDLRTYLRSLATLTSLHVEGRRVGGEDLSIKTFGAMKVSLIETTWGCRDSSFVAKDTVASRGDRDCDG